jgi:hypothetical protein
MAAPNTRELFKQYCLRRLGKPVIDINVDDTQLEDRIDDALRYYWDYHYDGTEKQYYKHQVTSTDVTNRYITLPENIIGAVNVFSIGDPSIRSDDLFNIRYQIALNDLYTLTGVSMVPYYTTFMHLGLIQELLVGKQPIRYNRNRNICHIDMDWDTVNLGEYLMIEAYEVVDPATYVDVWKDQWLLRYATALIKRQWGSNLTKFSGLQLPGGVQFNGDKIYDDASAEVDRLEADMIMNYSLPVMDMVG